MNNVFQEQRRGFDPEQEPSRLANAIGTHIHGARIRASATRGNLLNLFWTIGELLLRQESHGALSNGLFVKLSNRLRKGFPFLERSLTPEGLKGMQQLALTFEGIDQPSPNCLPYDGLIDDLSDAFDACALPQKSAKEGIEP